MSNRVPRNGVVTMVTRRTRNRCSEKDGQVDDEQRESKASLDLHNVTEFNNQRARARARACVYTRVYERPIELTCDCTAVSELCLAAENARDFPADRSNRAVSWTNARPARSSIMVTDRKLRRNVQ